MENKTLLRLKIKKMFEMTMQTTDKKLTWFIAVVSGLTGLMIGAGYLIKAMEWIWK